MSKKAYKPQPPMECRCGNTTFNQTRYAKFVCRSCGMEFCKPRTKSGSGVIAGRPYRAQYAVEIMNKR